MPNPSPDRPRADRRQLRTTLAIVLTFVALLWLIGLLDALFGLELYRWGVFPRDPSGLVGIVTAPLIHGSWAHLFANTLPLIVLGTALLYGYPRAARRALPILWLGSGLGVWLFARASFHIGASGIAHGMMFLVFLMGVLRRDRRAIALSLIVFFLYGGMLATILPGDPAVSFEAHLAGALIGAALAVWLRNLDPRPPEKKYSWELETEADEDEPEHDLAPPLEDERPDRHLH
jgi:membrane associated rhomboid family serine protease